MATAHDTKQDLAFDELVALTQQLGLYDDEIRRDPARLLITGSRHWPTDHVHTVTAAITQELAALRAAPGQPVVVDHGACPDRPPRGRSVDAIAAELVTQLRLAGAHWLTQDPLPADWETLGLSAGPIRNTQLVARRPHRALAFPTRKSVGTWDCAKKARRGHVPTRVVRSPDCDPPRRVQIRRSRGAHAGNAIAVTRPGPFGNPFAVGQHTTNADAVKQFEEYLTTHPDLVALIRHELAGWDLACFCPPSEPCHADLILQVANTEDTWA